MLSLRTAFRAAVFLAASCQPAPAQTLSDGTVSLSSSCDSLTTAQGRQQCQQAFEIFANELKDQQIRSAAGPRYVQFGEKDNPITVFIERPMRESFATIQALNGACKDIAVKKPHDKDSARLDDGSETGLLRVAERARHCADMAEMVSRATKAPFVMGIATAIRRHAEEVIPQVNRIASADMSFRRD